MIDDTHIVKHFDKVVNAYVKSPFYDNKKHIQQVIEKIKPYTQNKIIVDIGCGTCHFTELLQSKKMICVEPSKKMLFFRPQLNNQEKYPMDGLEFMSKTKFGYDTTIFKESIHYFNSDEQINIFKACHLRSNHIIITTRPKINHYPWFDKAQINFELSCIDIGDVQQRLENLGFSTIEQQISLPIKILRKEWLDLLKKRFWSNLSRFSDEELEYEIGLLDLGQERYITFDDHLTLLIASKHCMSKPSSI